MREVLNRAPLRICSVSAPYFLHIRVPLYGADTEQTRARHGSGTVRTLSGTSEKEIDSANGSFNIEVIETLVAFANTKGGTVYIGISDKRKIIGLSLNKETVQQLVNEVKCKTAPILIPDTEVIEYEGKMFVMHESICSAFNSSDSHSLRSSPNKSRRG